MKVTFDVTGRIGRTEWNWMGGIEIHIDMDIICLEGVITVDLSYFLNIDYYRSIVVVPLSLDQFLLISNNYAWKGGGNG